MILVLCETGDVVECVFAVREVNASKCAEDGVVGTALSPGPSAGPSLRNAGGWGNRGRLSH